MDVGFKSAGIHPVYANDVDFAACKTYGQNLGYIEHGPLNVKKVTDNNRGIDVIFGVLHVRVSQLLGKWTLKISEAHLFMISCQLLQA